MSDSGKIIDFATLQTRIQMRAAKARSAEEWFDIFQDIVFSGLKQCLAQAGAEGLKIADKVLDDQRHFYAKVRERFRVQGMDLSEGIDWEGPELGHDQFGFPRIMGWPRGMWAKATWGDHSSIEWRGKEAEIAVSFVIWWNCFHQVYMESMQTGVIVTDDMRRRLIDPGSTDWENYVKSKAAAENTPP